MTGSHAISTKLVTIGAGLLVVALLSIGLTLWVTWQLEGALNLLSVPLLDFIYAKTLSQFCEAVAVEKWRIVDMRKLVVIRIYFSATTGANHDYSRRTLCPGFN